MRPKPPRFKVDDKVWDVEDRPRVVIDMFYVSSDDKLSIDMFGKTGWVVYAVDPTRYDVAVGHECGYRPRD